ncbi:MAG: hypothetical protein WB629_15815, partial [Candidatus Sulfotelmatobacter sp.]
DPSLRLKNGSAQDDSRRVIVKLHLPFDGTAEAMPFSILVVLDFNHEAGSGITERGNLCAFLRFQRLRW